MDENMNISPSDIHNSLVSGLGPTTYLIDSVPEMDSEDYLPATAGGRNLLPIIRTSDFCAPSYPGISSPISVPDDIPPAARLDRDDDHCGCSGGFILYLDGMHALQPRYNLVDVQNYLLGNPWHYAAVKAKATAATELGYNWKYNSATKKGILRKSTGVLSRFEERVYEANHKDLGALLAEQAVDYFSTGNKALEVGYTVSGQVDCIYSIPAVTVFRHPYLPIACQILMPWENYFGLDVIQGAQFSAQVRSIMPLYKSGLTRQDVMRLLPEANPDLITRNELVHVTNSVISTDPIYGVADVIPALASLLGDNAANDYNWQFFENNAIPRYAVTVTGGKVDEKVKATILKFFNEHIQGQNHRTIVLPVPRGMTAEFKALDATPNEASFINYKKLNREEIAAVHRVPPSELGLWEDANRANSAQQSKNFFLKVIKPYQAQDEALMNRILMFGLGVSDVRFEFKNVEYTDDQERATVALTRAQAHQAYVAGLVDAVEAVIKAGAAMKKGPSSSSKSSSLEYDIQAGTGTGAPAAPQQPVPVPDPILGKDEAKSYILYFMDKIKSATETFGIEDPISGADN